MAAPARFEGRAMSTGTRRGASRATVPQRAAPSPSRERRPGGALRPAAEPAPARSRRRTAARGGTRVGGRMSAVRPVFLDRLLRGRSWVALIAVLLTGIVFLNVSLLEINGSIARMDDRAAELKRDNADLRLRVARLGSSERIRQAAAAQGFVAAPPGEVGYLTTRPDDASAAARALEDWRPPAPATSGDPSTAASGQGTAAGAAAGHSTAASRAGAATATATPSSATATPSAGSSNAADTTGTSSAGVRAGSGTAPGTDGETGGATP